MYFLWLFLYSNACMCEKHYPARKGGPSVDIIPNMGRQSQNFSIPCSSFQWKPDTLLLMAFSIMICHQDFTVKGWLWWNNKAEKEKQSGLKYLSFF